MAKCKYCDDEIQWKQPYETGDKPMNMDGSNHNCKKQTTLSTGSKGYVSDKIPMEKAIAFYNLVEGILDSFKAKRGIGPATTISTSWDVSPNPAGALDTTISTENFVPLSTDQEARFIEVMTETLMRYCKVD
jgi:hypothetical protein